MWEGRCLLNRFEPLMAQGLYWLLATTCIERVEIEVDFVSVGRDGRFDSIKKEAYFMCGKMVLERTKRFWTTLGTM
jgi:hypothetical protein